MLTFSEALVQLKSGQDLRVDTWPRAHFARMVMVRTPAGYAPELRLFKPSAPKGVLYIVPSNELFGQSWSIA